MSIKVWPFLVSRNRVIDYRTVVAPDFICDAGITKLLARVADGDLTEPGHAILRKVQGSKVGNFTIVFRVVKAIEKDIHPEGGEEILKDTFGREIYLIEGIVFKEMDDLAVTNENIEKAHQYLTKYYCRFWECSDPPSVISSQSFSLILNRTADLLALTEFEPFQVVAKTSTQRSQSEKDNITPTVKYQFDSIAIIAAVTTALLLAIWIVIKVNSSPGISQQPERIENIVAEYKQKAKKHHLYVSVKIPDEQANDTSNVPKLYWIIGQKGCEFTITEDGKSLHKIDERNITSKLIIGTSAITEEKDILCEDVNTFKNLRAKYPYAAIFLSKAGELPMKDYPYNNGIDNSQEIDNLHHLLCNQPAIPKITARIIQPKPAPVYQVPD
ncbi:hypothetical protein WA1_20120 [Scytonema hofmannii PCC 7110]|uniref:Uncharacterized protein n=1 Tax=Scytonema hofmannii PCC 7110 TaxID=128403 RepID=A0A139XC81_9CYAN|nr:hypothetical protein [Scytonema hofmannii]KYC42285.1 hypothetical protein WA1_20120 [Scytonema hofmannii PCC 7110]